DRLDLLVWRRRLDVAEVARDAADDVSEHVGVVLVYRFHECCASDRPIQVDIREVEDMRVPPGVAKLVGDSAAPARLFPCWAAREWVRYYCERAREVSGPPRELRIGVSVAADD